MKKAKRLLAALLSIAMVGSITACSSTPSSSGESSGGESTAGESSQAESSTGEKTKLVLFGLNDFDIPDFLTKFEEENNVEIQQILQPSDKFKESFIVAVNGGQQLDVGIINGQDVRSYAADGVIQDLTADIDFTDRFYENAVEQFTIGDKLYAVPTANLFCMALFYNKDIFDQYNLEPPKTYEDLKTIQSAISGDGIATISVGAANPYDLPNWFFVNYFQACDNKGMERTIATLKGEAKFTDQDYVDAMKYIQQFANDGMFQEGFLGADSASRIATFTSGKAAMYFAGTWDIPSFESAGMDLDRIGAVTWPIVKEGAKSEVSGTAAGFASVIYSASDPANKDLCIKLIDYLTNDEQTLIELDKMGAALSPNKNVKVENINSLNQQIQDDLVPNVVTFLDWVWPPEVTTALAEQTQYIMAGQTTPEEAMAEVQAAYDSAVAAGYEFQE